MNTKYIDSLLLFLLIFICMILYDSHKVVLFIKKNIIYYSGHTEEFDSNKKNTVLTQKIISIQEKPKISIKDNIKTESDKNITENNIITESNKNITGNKDIYDNYPDIEKNLYHYLTHPEPYNETQKTFEDNEYNDPAEQYLKVYNPQPLELENKTIRGHNFNNLDHYPKITQFVGDIPLKNNEFTYAMADGYIFKDSASI